MTQRPLDKFRVEQHRSPRDRTAGNWRALSVARKYQSSMSDRDLFYFTAARLYVAQHGRTHFPSLFGR
jgi:hypothetical protein